MLEIRDDEKMIQIFGGFRKLLEINLTQPSHSKSEVSNVRFKAQLQPKLGLSELSEF
jgi:hypothetical protein